MLFHSIKHWCCRLQAQHLQLWLDDKLQYQSAWQPQQPLAPQLEQLLSQIPVAPAWRDRLAFVVDIPHVSYLLVPWSEGISRPAELRQYAALLLAQQQDATPPMEVSFMHSRFGENAFAALLPQTLLMELKQLARTRRLRLDGCTTPFSGMLSGADRPLPDNALFACIGRQESSFACRWQQQWHSVFNLQLPPGEISQQLETANRLAGLPPLPRWVLHNLPETPPGSQATGEIAP